MLAGYFHARNAKNCVDTNPGYAAFDDSGNQVYPAVEKSFTPYLVKVSIDDLNYRKWLVTEVVSHIFYTGRSSAANAEHP